MTQVKIQGYQINNDTFGRSANHFLAGYIDNIQASVATGGTGSAGAGNQYVVVTINGTNYLKRKTIKNDIHKSKR